MADLTAQKLVNLVKANDPEGYILDLPMGATETIQKGAFVGLDAGDKFAAPLAAGEIFSGIALEKKVSGASNGDTTIKALGGQSMFQYAITSIAQADIGKLVYASDDHTLTLTSTSNSQVGRIVNVPATGTAIVQMKIVGEAQTQAATA
jgi:predicted RecA/RadA family phage recombinase